MLTKAKPDTDLAELPSAEEPYRLQDKFMPAAMLRAILKIKKTIEPAGRTGEGQDGEHNYKFASADDIFAALQRTMAYAGLVCELQNDGDEPFEAIEIAGKVAVRLSFVPVLYLVEGDAVDVYHNPRAALHMIGEWSGNNTCAALRTLAEKTYLRALFKLPAAPGSADAAVEHPRKEPSVAGDFIPAAEEGQGAASAPRSLMKRSVTMGKEDSAEGRGVIITCLEDAYGNAQEKSQDRADHVKAIENEFRKHAGRWARLSAADQSAVKAAQAKLIALASGAATKGAA